ncbi:MAG: alpha/beta hydrolase [Pyrinomonadaceae bacterium]
MLLSLVVSFRSVDVAHRLTAVISGCLVFSSGLQLGGCATPAQRIEAEAARYGFTRVVTQGTEFPHVVFLNEVDSVGMPLHVYLEGDGSPWIAGDYPAADPTSHQPIMLRLMAFDDAPSLYLGRPCYLGLAQGSYCDPSLWTHARYSERVVDSLESALRRLLPRNKTSGLVFIGHSGGGTLALLLAVRFETTRAVLTLAGNLDTEAWVDHHGYWPLADSLNPAKRSGLQPGIVERHYVGLRDREVPMKLAERYKAAHPRAVIIPVPEFDHGCCWHQMWPGILEALDRGLKADQNNARKHENPTVRSNVRDEGRNSRRRSGWRLSAHEQLDAVGSKPWCMRRCPRTNKPIPTSRKRGDSERWPHGGFAVGNHQAQCPYALYGLQLLSHVLRLCSRSGF